MSKPKTTEENKNPKCPACLDTGDCFKKRYGGKRYWYPCPVCNGGKWDEPNMERYEKYKEENP